MILQIFTVFDSKAEAYLAPFHSPTIGLAMRSFAKACNEEGHDFHQYSGDYTLFHIGSFDQPTGQHTLLKAFANLGLAATYMQAEAQPGSEANPVVNLNN